MKYNELTEKIIKKTCWFNY